MKTTIFIIIFLILFGCASAPRENLISKSVSYVPASAQKNLKGLDPDAFQKAIEAGFRKLPLEELYSFNQKRLIMLRASRENCLSFLDEGAIASAKKQKALEALSNDEYEQYAKVIAKAIALGADSEAKVTPRPSKNEFDKAFGIALDAELVGGKLSYIKTKEPHPTDVQCESLYKALNYADQKRNKIAETIVKYLGM